MADVHRRLHEARQIPGDDADSELLQRIDELSEGLRIDDVDGAAVVRRLSVDGAHAACCDARSSGLGTAIRGGVVDVDPGAEPHEHAGVRTRCRPRSDRREHEESGSCGECETAHSPECTNEV